MYYLQKKTLKNNADKRSICVHHHHEWRPLFYLRAEYNWITTLRNLGYDIYTICAGKTILDKWSKKFYESFGFVIASAEYLEDNIPHMEMLFQNKD